MTTDPAATDAGALPPLRDWLPHRRPPRCLRRWIFVAAVTATFAYALVAAAVPSRCIVCGQRSSESAAIATLKNILHAQQSFQAARHCDDDRDGLGEYGFLAELAGAVPVRRSHGHLADVLEVPLLASGFAAVSGGRVRRAGYLFQVFLRGSGGVWIPETSDGGGPGPGIDADLAERDWLAYAWPIERGVTGRRAFAITARADVLASSMDHEVYSGDFGPPAGVAGFCLHDGALQPAANATDLRGNVWCVVD